MRNLHKFAAIGAMVIIALFFLSTLISEIFLGVEEIVFVKIAITYLIPFLVIFMALTGISGNKLGKKINSKEVLAKQKLIKIVAVNGILVLIPLAFTLRSYAENLEFTLFFWSLQILELIAGATNLFLMSKLARLGKELKHFKTT